MLPAMIPEAYRLHAAMVAAFPDYVTSVFAERGYPLDRHAVETIEHAAVALDWALSEELSLPFRRQRRGPLELFQSAARTTAQVLEEAGIAPLQSSGRMGEIDPYGLVPGSSSALGTEVHEAHLAWGAAKAAAFVETHHPTAKGKVTLVLAGDRSERAALVDALGSSGVVCVSVRNPAGVSDALDESIVLGAVVDLDHRSGREVIRSLLGAGVPTVAFGDGIDDLTETGLRAQGVRTVVERRQLLDDPRRYVPLIT